MSWNRIILIFTAIYLFSITELCAKELRVISEDELIIKGLFFNQYRAYEQSREVFAKLYDTTGTKEYLFTEVTSSLMANTHLVNSLNRLIIWDKKYPNNIEAKRLLIPLYLTNRQTKEARAEASCLMEISTEAKDFDLASSAYLYSGEFKKALELLEKAYTKSSNEEVLLRMATIMDEHTNENKKAIQLLDMHRRINIVVSDKLYFKLISLYIKDGNIDGILEIYKLLYEHNQDERYLTKIIEAYAYKRDIDGAILFLEKNANSDVILYELYKNKKYFDKAINLLVKLYKNDNNPVWLAEKAILIFENAQNKNDSVMIKEVIKYFDKAISEGVDDSIYLNYYGYTLIDKNIDIKKGMKIISDALIQQPDNTYYLDSLAWGYYKINACDKAYDMMSSVVKKEGLEESEIAEHWEAIQNCK